MKKTMMVVLALSTAALLSGCTVDSADHAVSYDTFEPGYTGYTVGHGAYGIPNGYGPSYWNPGYISYTGYNRAYMGRPYYGGTRYYHSGYVRRGYAGGYHRR